MLSDLSQICSHIRGPRGAQSVELPTLGISSGHDPAVREIEPRIGLCADSAEPAWDSLSLACSCSLSLKINFKHFLKTQAQIASCFLSCSKVYTITVTIGQGWLGSPTSSEWEKRSEFWKVQGLSP